MQFLVPTERLLVTLLRRPGCMCKGLSVDFCDPTLIGLVQ